MKEKRGSRIAPYQPPDKPLKKFNVIPKFVDVAKHRDQFWLPNTGDIQIEYKPAYPAGEQARFRNRAVFKPEFDLKCFRADAVLDFIKIVFTSDKVISWSGVSINLGSLLGEPISVAGSKVVVETGRVGLEARMQTPTAERVGKLMNALVSELGFECSGQIAQLEVSLDWYAHSQEDEDRWKMTEILWRHFLPDKSYLQDANGTPRCAWRSNLEKDRPGGDPGLSWLIRVPRNKSETRSEEHYSEVRIRSDPARSAALKIANFTQPCLNGTYYIGPKRGDVMFRIMHKALDKQNRKSGEGDQLSKKKRRARIEVTISGDELMRMKLDRVDTIAEGLKKVRTEYFRFYLPTVEYHGVRAKQLPKVMAAVNVPRRMLYFQEAGPQDDLLVACQRLAQRPRQSPPDFGMASSLACGCPRCAACPGNVSTLIVR